MIRKLERWWNRGTCWWDKWNSLGGWFRCKRAEIMLEIYRPRIDRAPRHLKDGIDFNDGECFSMTDTPIMIVPDPAPFSDEIAKQIYESNQTNSKKHRPN